VVRLGSPKPCTAPPALNPLNTPNLPARRSIVAKGGLQPSLATNRHSAGRFVAKKGFLAPRPWSVSRSELPILAAGLMFGVSGRLHRLNPPNLEPPGYIGASGRFRRTAPAAAIIRAASRRSSVGRAADF
jgi:hypothetical protein